MADDQQSTVEQTDYESIDFIFGSKVFSKPDAEMIKLIFEGEELTGGTNQDGPSAKSSGKNKGGSSKPKGAFKITDRKRCNTREKLSSVASGQEGSTTGSTIDGTLSSNVSAKKPQGKTKPTPKPKEKQTSSIESTVADSTVDVLSIYSDCISKVSSQQSTAASAGPMQSSNKPKGPDRKPSVNKQKSAATTPTTSTTRSSGGNSSASAIGSKHDSKLHKSAISSTGGGSSLDSSVSTSISCSSTGGSKVTSSKVANTPVKSNDATAKRTKSLDSKPKQSKTDDSKGAK